MVIDTIRPEPCWHGVLLLALPRTCSSLLLFLLSLHPSSSSLPLHPSFPLFTLSLLCPMLRTSVIHRVKEIELEE